MATVGFIFHRENLHLIRAFGLWIGTPVGLVPKFTALLGHLERFAALGGMTLLLAAGGRRALRLAPVAFDNSWEELVLSYGLGCGVWGTVLFLLGAAGFWRRPFLLTLLAVGALASLWELRRFRRERRSPSGACAGKPGVLDRVCAAALLFGWLYIVRYALVPETFYDALHYHLALPNLYLGAGRIFATPENSFSGVPGLPQMLFGWTLAFDRWGIVASLLHWSQALWAAAALIALSRRLGRPQAGFLAAAAFGLMPVVLGESFRVSVGLEWTVMELCALTAFLAALSKEPGTAERRNWIVLCGAFLGFVMSMKYPAWLLPLAFLPGLALKKSSEPGAEAGAPLAWREFALIAAIGGLFLAPWVIKNIAFYHNPLYPFFHEVVVPKAEYMPNWRQISMAGTDLQSLFSVQGFVRYLAHPWRMLTPPDDVTESVGPFALALLPLVFLVRLSKRERLLGWFCAAAWIPFSLISSETRFFIPHLAPLILLISCAVVQIPERRSRIVVMALACALWAGPAFAWIVLDANRAKLETYLGRKSFSEYLEHTVVSYPAPAYAGFEFINETTPPGTRVLLYGESRSFYLRRPLLAASSDQAAVIEAWADQAADADALKKRLDAEGIRYILVNLGEIARRRRAPTTTARGLLTLDAFWKRYTLRVFGVQNPPDRWLGVYKVLGEDEAAKPHPFDDLFAVYVGRLKAAK